MDEEIWLIADRKEIIILGGPNGAGKTTAARVLLPDFLDLHPFLNADDIARDLSPWDVDSAALAAGRRMIEQMRTLVQDGQSFAFETTCSGKPHLRLLQQCKQVGWRITLLYFWLPSPEDAVKRVARRVSQGGHNIPTDTVLRRYFASVSNMRNLYLPLADEAEIYDYTDRRRILIAEKRGDLALFVHDPERWAKIEEVSR
jgi:predicted ABC-type ATPase